MRTKILLVNFLLLSTFVTLFSQYTEQKTMEFEGNIRYFTVYIPEGYDELNSHPLVFNFHGGGGNIDSQIAVSDMRPIADTDGFLIVYPQALGDPNDDGSTNWTHKEPTDHDDTFFVEAMIEQLNDEYNINNNRIYACGYSNGGEFAFELACKLSTRIAAIGAVARSMFIDTYETCSPTHPMPVVTIHGTEDDYEGIEWAGTLYYVSLDDLNSFWSNFNETDENPTITELPDANVVDGSTVEHHVWENGNSCVSVEHFKVLGGGHDWPGTFGNMDINANEEIWNFVSRYDLSGLIDCPPTSTIDIENNLTFFPNPVADFLNIENQVSENLYFEIYSIDGKIKKSGIITPDLNAIDLHSLDANIYFLKIGTKTIKIVKS